MRFQRFCIPLFIIGLMATTTTWASLPFLISSTVTSSTSNSNTTNNEASVLTKDQIETIAKHWNLSSEDYERYLELMKTTPSGKWYVQSDPSEVLAINARNDAEREKYAEIIAKTTHDRLESELAMQHAFNTAWQKLYPNLKPIEMPMQSQAKTQVSLQVGDQLLLFTGINDSSSTTIIDRLISLIQNHSGTKLAIFITGNDISDKAIRDWAQSNHIPISLVQQGTIILDHDKGRFTQITKGKGTLPTVILNHKGNFNTVSINQLNG